MSATERKIDRHVSFTPEQDEKLRQFAQAKRWTMAEAVREAVVRMLAQDSVQG